MGTGRLRNAIIAIAIPFGLIATRLPAAADTSLVVGKANSEAESIMTVNVGDDAGIFKKHGLDLKIEDFNGGGSRVVQALSPRSGVTAGCRIRLEQSRQWVRMKNVGDVQVGWMTTPPSCDAYWSFPQMPELD